MSEQQEPRYISIDNAARELGVNKSTIYYYLRQFSITSHKFPLDRRTYLKREDFERIQSAKRAAAEGRH